MRTILRRAGPWLLLAGYLIGVEWLWGWRMILAPWREMAWSSLTIVLCLAMLSYALRAWRVADYFRGPTRGRWGLVLRLTLYHNLLNNLLPARTGELSFPWMMKRYFAVGYAESTSALVWFRLLDLHAVLTAWVLGLAVSTRPAWVWPLLLAWLMLPAAVLGARTYLARGIERLPEGRWRTRLGNAVAGLPSGWGTLLRSWGWTWINWVVKLLALVWLLGQWLDAGLAARVSGVVAGELTSVLPAHAPAGVGTYEAGVVLGLAPFGVETGAAVSAAVNLHLFILVSAMLGGLLAFLPGTRPAPNPPEETS